jgi:hypothetical protein
MKNDPPPSPSTRTRPVLSEAHPSPANTAHAAASALMCAASSLFAAATEHAAGNNTEADIHTVEAMGALVDALARDPFKRVPTLPDTPPVAEAVRAALDAVTLLALDVMHTAAGEPDMAAATDLARRRLIAAAAALPEPTPLGDRPSN